jgi:hypothetical protein
LALCIGDSGCPLDELRGTPAAAELEGKGGFKLGPEETTTRHHTKA